MYLHGGSRLAGHSVNHGVVRVGMMRQEDIYFIHLFIYLLNVCVCMYMYCYNVVSYNMYSHYILADGYSSMYVGKSGETTCFVLFCLF